MSASMLKGTGSVSAQTDFQLLDPTLIFDADKFSYDLYLEGTSADALAIWQMDYQGSYYVDAPGASGVSGNTGAGSKEWLRNVPFDTDSGGNARISVSSGTVNYFYSLNGKAAYPTTLAASGATSSSTEFFVEPGRIYTVTSDGTHEWQYYDGSAFVAFSQGTESGFTFDSPPSQRIKLVPTGAVNFSLDSRKP